MEGKKNKMEKRGKWDLFRLLGTEKKNAVKMGVNGSRGETTCKWGPGMT